MKKYIHQLLRLAFGFLLVAFAYLNLSQIKTTEGVVKQSLDGLHGYTSKFYDVSFLKEHSFSLIYLQFFLFLGCGMFTMFGFCIKGVLALPVLLIQILLVNNPLLDSNQTLTASAYLSLFGAIINI